MAKFVGNQNLRITTLHKEYGYQLWNIRIQNKRNCTNCWINPRELCPTVKREIGKKWIETITIFQVKNEVFERSLVAVQLMDNGCWWCVLLCIGRRFIRYTLYIAYEWDKILTERVRRAIKSCLLPARY